MSAHLHDDADTERRVERRRWFERAVMVPVGFGMVATFAATGTAHLAAALGAPIWLVEKPWVMAVLIIVPCGIFVLTRSMRG